ncbi:zinc finger domain-containing protein [Saccharopolyspora hattusasensis]|uniref:zinc finger domain-containing protein n=1 Tax=Saccharopolyspora hattusasensis TaxID=1128679 RepID=UPI003D952FE8
MTVPANELIPRGDIARLLALASAYDQRTIGLADVMAWQEALAGCDKVEVEAAILALSKNSTQRITPPMILDSIRKARQAKANRPGARPTEQQRAAECARHTAAGKRGIELVYQQMNWHRSEDRNTALNVACPACGAAPNVRCRRKGRTPAGREEHRDLRIHAHPSRIEAAHRATKSSNHEVPA